MLNILHSVFSLLLATFCGWAIMSRHVNDGIVIKIGLATGSIGFLGEFFISVSVSSDLRALIFSHTLVSLGLLICVAGYLLRTRKHSRRVKHRRVSDWVSGVTR